MSVASVRPLRVAIFTDETGWHTTRLRRALEARGATGRCVDLADCRFDTTWSAHGLVIPGFGRELPDAALVRGIAAGSFEQVTKRLGILHALRELGVPVYNDARGIERSVDKSMTSFLLHRHGLPTPPTWAGESIAHARRTVMRETAAGRSLVLKPLFGSQGRGLQRVGSVDGTPVPLPDDLGAGSGYGSLPYLQRFVPPAGEPGFDWRVLVVGGRAVAAMRRVSRHWIHNVAQGARCVAAELAPPLAALAQQAAAALELDYAGVDIMPALKETPGRSQVSLPPSGGGLGLPSPGGAHDGLQVIEVNGVAAWRGLQSVSRIDIAQCIVDDLLVRRLGWQPGRLDLDGGQGAGTPRAA